MLLDKSANLAICHPSLSVINLCKNCNHRNFRKSIIKALHFSGKHFGICLATNSEFSTSWWPVWPEENRQMSVKVAQKWFH